MYPLPSLGSDVSLARRDTGTPTPMGATARSQAVTGIYRERESGLGRRGVGVRGGTHYTWCRRPGDKWAGEGFSCAGTSPAAGDSLVAPFVYFRVAVTTVVMGIEPLRQGGRASSDLSGCSDTHQAGNNNMPQLGLFSVGGVT